MRAEGKVFYMGPLKSTAMGLGESREYPESMKRFRVPNDWEKQSGQIKEEAAVFQPAESSLLQRENDFLRTQDKANQGTIETLRKRLEAAEKRIKELEEMQAEKKTEPEETFDSTWRNNSNMRQRQRLAQQLNPQNTKKVIETELEKSKSVKDATETIDRITKAREEEFKKQAKEQPTEKKRENRYEETQQISTETLQKRQREIKEAVDKRVSEELVKIQAEFQKQMEEIREAAQGEIDKAKAAAQEEIRKAKAEGEIKTKEAKEQGEKEGKEKLWAEIKQKRSWKNKFRIFFRPKTDAEKYLRKEYRKKVLIGVGVAAATVATWAAMQYFGRFLPSIPINIGAL